MVIALHLIALVSPLAAAEAAAMGAEPLSIQIHALHLVQFNQTQHWLKWTVNSGQENGQLQEIIDILAVRISNCKFYNLNTSLSSAQPTPALP